MKDQASQTSQNYLIRLTRIESFQMLNRIGLGIAVGRIFLALAAAAAFSTVSTQGSLVLLLVLLCLPVAPVFNVTLRSGRVVQQATAKTILLFPTMAKVLEIRYEACSGDYESVEFLREEVEVSTAVMAECDRLDIASIEIMAILPTKVHGLKLGQVSAKQFQKINGRWIEATA